jgi:PAS domain S-box-containing protein
MKLEPNLGAIFIDIIPDMCFVVSDDLSVISYNKKARELLGLPERPEENIPFYSLLAEDSPHPLMTVLRTKERSPEAEVQFKTRDGGIIDALLFIRKISGVGKDFLYVIARDVSEEKKKELDLLRFSNVVHYTVNPIQITDARGRMIYVNPAFEQVTGYSRDELIGGLPSIISSRKYPPEFWAAVWRKISAGQVWNGEIENTRKDGEPIYTHLLISPIIDNDGTVVGYLGAHRDITKQKQLEQQLMHSQKMESLGTLSAGIAHEVGNPLASISSIVQVILRTTADDYAKEKLMLVESQVHRITKIIRDLVDFSRPSNYQVQPTNVGKILTESVEIVKLAKKAKNISFRIQIPSKVPVISLVPDQISQVFINILLNAVDAMEGKEGKVEASIQTNDRSMIISIADTGPGIPAENHEKIFEPFFTTKRVGEGTGMGLWVSYGIVQSFRGDIAVKSSKGKGAIFTITLPLNTKEYDNA